MMDAGVFDALLALLQAVAAVRSRAQDRTTMLALDAGKRHWLV